MSSKKSSVDVEKAWRALNKKLVANRSLAWGLLNREAVAKSALENHGLVLGEEIPYDDFQKTKRYLLQDTRPWRVGEIFWTTRCGGTESFKQKAGPHRFFIERIWCGFWKSFLFMYIPAQIWAMLYPAADNQPADWDFIAGISILFISYFFYHQSNFVSRRQKLRDNLGFPNKSANRKKKDLVTYQKIDDKMMKQVARQKEKERKISEAKLKAKQAHLLLSHKARIPKHADDFEEVCAEWMRSAGYKGARRTAKGPDGGADVVASSAVAQCKMYSAKKVTAEEVRALAGTRQEYGKKLALFFIYGLGYTEDAIRAAKKTQVQLFQLDVDMRIFKRVTPPYENVDDGDYGFSDEEEDE